VSDRSTLNNLANERRAAEALRETLTKLPGVDEETVRDTIEGETGLHEAIANAVAILTDTEVMAEGLRAKIKEFLARLARYDARVDFTRSAIEQAMVIGELKKLELPDCTLSLSNRAPGLVITDEARVPSVFWKQPPPVLDKAALKAALKDKQDVPGASLSNGSVSFTVRRA
jgi:hypothetical protein